MRSIAHRSLGELRQARLRLLASPSWKCTRCRLNDGFRTRLFGTSSSSSSSSNSVSSPSTSKEKPYYITTPIFYVNAAPHIGHLYTMVLTDVLKRWQQLKGREAFMLTGTDEHGMKIQRAASLENVPPKQFCDGNAQKFRELAAAGEISHDHFIRTTDKEHKDAVGEFWLNLKHRLPEDLGLYKGTHEGWYCVSDECFYPEDLVRPSIRPQTGKKVMISTESENEVEWVKEETWFFPLTKYKDILLKFYDENPDWVQPASRMREVRDWVENHLEDLSVTRPYSRLSWGIQDPEDLSQTIYVWVDALVNYITQAGYGSKWRSPKEDMGLWPADLQVIGKDILRFHAVYWPALLLALGLPPPKRILCHNHWTMSNFKMSKSRGNVVNPFFALQRWEEDPLRYFLMLNGSLTKDMSYSNELIGATYQKHLMANIGNLLGRVALVKSNSRWSVLQAVKAYRSGDFGQLSTVKEWEEKLAMYTSLDEDLVKRPAAAIREMDELNPGGALKQIFELLRETNRYFTDCAPWHLSEEHQHIINYVVYQAAEALRISGILLLPVMPARMNRLLDDLGVSPSRRTLQHAANGADDSYGRSYEPSEIKKSKWETIFPPPSNPDNSDAELMKKIGDKFGSDTQISTFQMMQYLELEARVGEEEARAVVEKAFKEKQTLSLQEKARLIMMKEGGSKL